MAGIDSPAGAGPPGSPQALRDDINAPLGPPPTEPSALARLAPWLGRGLVAALIGGAAFGGYSLWKARTDRLAGAVAHIETVTPPAAPTTPAPAGAMVPAATAPAGDHPGLSPTASAKDVEAATARVAQLSQPCTGSLKSSTWTLTTASTRGLRARRAASASGS